MKRLRSLPARALARPRRPPAEPAAQLPVQAPLTVRVASPQADQPIAYAAEDRLGRGAFARRAAQVVGEVQGMEDSSVLGLAGPWGSGKSSLINLICEEIGEPWQVCRANMWAPPDVAGLLAELFATIRSALPDGGAAGRARALFAEYAKLAVPALSIVPVVGDAAEGIAANIVDYRADRPMSQVFEQLSAQLRRLGLRVLVVLDDVDRLQPDELLMLFKAIRLLARFPGVYYLLAYDEQTVIDVLVGTPIAEGSPERALAYLEKIVQVRLDLPPAQRYYTEQMLSDGIIELLGRLSMMMTDEQTFRFRELYDNLLQFTLAQPRAVGRFLRQAFAYLPMTDPGEFDLVDFLALTHLRSLAPGSYQVLARSKEPLTRAPGNADEPAAAALRELLRTRISAECGDAAERVMEVVTELFPAIGGEEGAGFTTADWRQRAASMRASADEYFDRYFLFGLAAGDIADSTACGALTAIARSERTPALTEAEAAITGPDPAAASAVIRKLARLSASDGVVEAADLGEVVRYALSLPAKASPSPGALLGSAEHQGVTWAAELLGRMGRSGLQPDPAMAAGLDDTALALLCDALGQAARPPGQQRKTLLAACDQVAAHAADRVLAHLRQGDDASPELPVALLVHFVNRTTARGGLAGAIAAELSAGRITLADLAARFVTVGRLWDGREELVGFDSDALVSLMGLTRLWDLLAAAPPDDAAAEDGSSWPGRRGAGLAALGRALAEQRALPPRPPSGARGGSEPNPAQGTGPRQWASRIPAPAPSPDSGAALLCFRAAVLLPGSATGMPGSPATASVFEEARARALAAILGRVPFTAWCRNAALERGLELGPEWEEEGFASRSYAELALKANSAESQQVEGMCAFVAGSSRAGDPDVACLALDLILRFPASAGELSTVELTEIIEVTTSSAIQAAREAAATLLNIAPDDGHLALWLEATEAFDRMIDLRQFPAVGGQTAQATAAVSARLPLEPGQAPGSAHFTDSLRGIAVELIHEMLRSSQRRGYSAALHALRDANRD